MRTAQPLPAAWQHRSFSVADAVANGIPEQRLRRRDLHAPFHGVRAPASAHLDDLELARAYASRPAAELVFAHATAAKIWGFPMPGWLERGTDLHVLHLGGGRAPRGRGIVGHKTLKRLIPERVSGLNVTSAIDTWLMLGRCLSVDELIVAGDRLLQWQGELATRDAMDDSIRANTGARGIRNARLAFDEIRAGSRSPRETLTRLAITRCGLPYPSLNAPIALANGSVVHGDLVWRRWRVVLEYEGEQHLYDDAQWAKDLRRYNDLSAVGWVTIRITKRMLPPEIVAVTARALKSAGWRAR
ncbi:hypothetical protein FHX49_000200 [Microbacterium endophyticum]|uniref:DUF559 domain-containing protein n=1 Tax=Microbacterium endophyticum TaxID=1526412 RepID=A0A7W4V171_9MICO|nr:hypothetical protein [Microbacterium endophyticum]MBB2974659.1 hypothetical protein [Microbacterium endophyticum]NIK36956.1 hypothetical protein [Microbacterium endophyticum]